MLLNVDRVAEQLEELGYPAIQVRGLADSGWFLDNKQYRGTDCVDTVTCAPTEAIRRGIRCQRPGGWPGAGRLSGPSAERLSGGWRWGRGRGLPDPQPMPRYWNGVVPERCRHQFKDGEEWNCFFGYKVYPTLRCEGLAAVGRGAGAGGEQGVLGQASSGLESRGRPGGTPLPAYTGAGYLHSLGLPGSLPVSALAMHLAPGKPGWLVTLCTFSQECAQHESLCCPCWGLGRPSLLHPQRDITKFWSKQRAWEPGRGRGWGMCNRVLPQTRVPWGLGASTPRERAQQVCKPTVALAGTPEALRLGWGPSAEAKPS